MGRPWLSIVRRRARASRKIARLQIHAVEKLDFPLRDLIGVNVTLRPRSGRALSLNRAGFAGGPNSRENGAMEAKKTTNTFSPEVRARAVRMVREHRDEYEVVPIAPSIYRAHATRRRDTARASARPRRAVFGAPAAYPAADGVYIAFGEQEPELMFWTGGGLTALKIRPGFPPTITTAWSAPLRGSGFATATTTEGHSNPIVWSVGADGDNRLHGVRGDTGELLFVGPTRPMVGVRRLRTLIAILDGVRDDGAA